MKEYIILSCFSSVNCSCCRLEKKTLLLCEFDLAIDFKKRRKKETDEHRYIISHKENRKRQNEKKKKK